MPIYGSQLFKLYDKNIMSMEKGNKRNLENSEYFSLPFTALNDCNYIDSILEKWCIQFLYNIFYSEISYILR